MLLIGDKAVGKSSFLLRHCTGEFVRQGLLLCASHDCDWVLGSVWHARLAFVMQSGVEQRETPRPQHPRSLLLSDHSMAQHNATSESPMRRMRRWFRCALPQRVASPALGRLQGVCKMSAMCLPHGAFSKVPRRYGDCAYTGSNMVPSQIAKMLMLAAQLRIVLNLWELDPAAEERKFGQAQAMA